MKKIVKIKNISIAIFLALIIILNYYNVSFAEKYDNYTSEDKFYTLSITNNEHDKYAQENIYRFVTSSNDLDLHKNFKLGQGITIVNEDGQERTLYPIYKNNEIVSTFLVATYQDEVGGVYSIAYANKLNKIHKLATKEKPLMLISFNDDLWSVIDNIAYSLNELTELKFDNLIENKNLTVKNNKDYLEYNSNNFSLRMPSNYVLRFNIKYIQPKGVEKCYSYALANILYNKGYDWHTPQRIAKYFNYADGVNIKTLSKYLDKYNFRHVTSNIGYLSKDSVREQIYIKNNYILIGGIDNVDEGHAFVIFGYNNSKNTYSFWNPWYNFTQYMDMDSRLMSTKDSIVYRWEAGYIKDISKIK